MGNFYLSALSGDFKSNEEYFRSKVSDENEFLEQFGSLDKKLTIPNFQLIFFREGTENKWGNAENKRGGRFLIYFPSNVQAIRTFCLFSVEWIQKNISFHSNIVGLVAHTKPNANILQIWVNDGLDSENLSPRYEYLINWLIGSASIDESVVNDEIQIEFLLHPNYRVYRSNDSRISLANEMRAQAIQIPSFQYCIKQLFSDEEEAPVVPKFDLKIATMHKRSRKERRLRPSYVDSLAVQ